MARKTWTTFLSTLSFSTKLGLALTGFAFFYLSVRMAASTIGLF